MKATNLRLNKRSTLIFDNHEKYYLNLPSMKIYFGSKTDLVNKIIQYLVENGILVEDENFES